MIEEQAAAILARLEAIDTKLDRLAESKPVSLGEYLTVAEAAEYFNVSTSSLYPLKPLQHRRGASIRFRRSELERHFKLGTV
jgi:hypothetical protein